MPPSKDAEGKAIWLKANRNSSIFRTAREKMEATLIELRAKPHEVVEIKDFALLSSATLIDMMVVAHVRKLCQAANAARKEPKPDVNFSKMAASDAREFLSEAAVELLVDDFFQFGMVFPSPKSLPISSALMQEERRRLDKARAYAAAKAKQQAEEKARKEAEAKSQADAEAVKKADAEALAEAEAQLRELEEEQEISDELQSSPPSAEALRTRVMSISGSEDDLEGSFLSRAAITQQIMQQNCQRRKESAKRTKPAKTPRQRKRNARPANGTRSQKDSTSTPPPLRARARTANLASRLMTAPPKKAPTATPTTMLRPTPCSKG
jgi:hypothetical protein